MSNNHEPTHTDVLVAIAVIEGKLDRLITETKELRLDHEHRIRDIERSKWRLQGISAIVGLFAGTIASVLFKQ